MTRLGILRTATAALSGYFLFGAFRFVIGLILPGLTLEFGLSSVESGFFAAAPILSSVLTMAIAGYISDRIGSKIVFVAGMFVLWLAALLTSFSPTYPLAVFSIFVAGMAAGFLSPSGYSIMGNLRSTSRGALIGITSSIYNFGGFAGSIGLGVVIALDGWRFGLTTLSSLGLILIPIMIVFIGFSTRERSEKESRHLNTSSLALLKSKKVLFAGASLFMAMYGSFTIITWMPSYLIHIGISSSLTGAVIGANSLAGGVGAIVSGRLADKWNEKRLIVSTGMMGALASVPLFLYRVNFVAAIVLMMLLGFLIWPSWNLITSLGQRMVRPAGVGTITGLIQTLGMSGAFLGPLLTGFVIKYYGLELALIGSVVTSMFLYVLLMVPSLSTHEIPALPRSE